MALLVSAILIVIIIITIVMKVKHQIFYEEYYAIKHGPMNKIIHSLPPILRYYPLIWAYRIRAKAAWVRLRECDRLVEYSGRSFYEIEHTEDPCMEKSYMHLWDMWADRISIIHRTIETLIALR